MLNLKNAIAAGMVWLSTAGAAQANGLIDISEYADGYRWLQQADQLADAQVTYEICGWGRISLASEALEASKADPVKVRLWGEFLRRFDDAVRERRRVEAFFLAFGLPAHSRTRGPFATGGCGEAVKWEIEGWRVTAPAP